MQPTVLIGFNEYGRTLLQRLLISASDRGALRWTREGSGPDAGRLQLRDLALLVCSPPQAGAGGSSPFEEDLYRQIKTVSEKELRQEVMAAKNRLLSASHFVQDGARGQYSLDVIAMAHPASERDFRVMRDSLAKVMTELASDPNFRAAGEGNDLLSMIQVLDFDEYWGSDSGNRHVTELAADYVASWEARTAAGEPGCSRIYLADSNAGGGYRRMPQRVQEAVLFLELILFEEQRDDPGLRYLVQCRTRSEPIAASFGVRVIERQRSLMKRIAASLFSYRWLRYLEGQDFPLDRPQGADIREALRHLETDSLATEEELKELDKRCKEKIEAAIPELLAARSTGSAQGQPGDHLATVWVKEFERRTRARLETIRLEVEDAAGKMLEGKTRASLMHARSEIRESVGNALQHPQYPVPVGKLIQDLRAIAAQLRKADSQGAELTMASLESRQFEPIRQLYSDYLWYKSQQINPAEATKWIWIWPVILGACFAPLVAVAAQDFPEPGADAGGIAQVLSGIKGVLSQLPPAWLLVMALAALATVLARRAIIRRVDRGIQVHAHETQGRIRAACASLLQSPQLLRHLSDRIRALALLRTNRVRSEVLRELSFAEYRLQQRRNELDWLSSQMRRFCVLHGIDPDEVNPSYRPPDASSNIYTFWVAQRADFSQMLKSSEGQAERFQSLQAAVSPFAHWMEKYCPTFLHPVQFIDWLCEQQAFETPDVAPSDARALDDWANDVSDKVRQIGLVPIGFRFGDVDQQHEQERLCLLPQDWRGLPGLTDQLQDTGLTSSNVRTMTRPGRADRAYFLSYQLAVKPSRMKEKVVS